MFCEAAHGASATCSRAVPAPTVDSMQNSEARRSPHLHVRISYTRCIACLCGCGCHRGSCLISGFHAGTARAAPPASLSHTVSTILGTALVLRGAGRRRGQGIPCGSSDSMKPVAASLRLPSSFNPHQNWTKCDQFARVVPSLRVLDSLHRAAEALCAETRKGGEPR